MKSDHRKPATLKHRDTMNAPYRQQFLSEEPALTHGSSLADERAGVSVAPQPKQHQAKRPCQRTLVVGTGETGQRLAAELVRHFDDEFCVVGWVSDPADETQTPENLPPEINVLGTRAQLADLVRRHRIDRVMFSNCVDWQLENPDFQRRASDRRAERPSGRNPRIPGQEGRERRREVADLYTWATSPSFFWPDARRARFYRFSKRSFDIGFALAALAVSLPIAVFVLPAIKFSSPGPIFYAQERVGRGGVPFTIYKLRTMRMDAETASGPMLSPHGDTRNTAVGRLLRATKLDEVPQFWNVLKGEMSIVGPRPERPHFVEPFSGHIYSYSLRHAVRPGLTGLAQIKGDHLTHVYVKLHYDLIYVCHRRFALDLMILAKTPLTILRNMLRRE